MFIACCHRLKCLAEVVEVTWPDSMVQTGVVHLIRAANRWVAHCERKAVSAVFKKVYAARDETTAKAAPDEFEECVGAFRVISAVLTDGRESVLYDQFHRVNE